MDNFDYKKYIKEGKLLNELEDMRPKDIEFEKAKEEERLANHPEEETIRKIQAMFAKEKSLEEDDNKIKDLESQLDFHTQMDNMGRASIIKDKIEKLRKLSNSGEIDGDEFLDKFNPLSKELKSLDEVVNSAKSALKTMPMSDVYIKSLESDVEKNGEDGYVDFRKDDWVEDYSEFIVDKLDS